jgi:hypothetical protein
MSSVALSQRTITDTTPTFADQASSQQMIQSYKTSKTFKSEVFLVSSNGMFPCGSGFATRVGGTFLFHFLINRQMKRYQIYFFTANSFQFINK